MPDTHSTIPPALLDALTAEGGGRVVLIVGAGCSMEDPPGLPSGNDCARMAFERLLRNGYLTDGDCGASPTLSEVADVALAKHVPRRTIVEALPISLFRDAKPNDGYKIAIALLLEGALRDVLTLNFDSAFRNAVTDLGPVTTLGVITQPAEFHQIRNQNLIYLHGAVGTPPESWVLTSNDLNDSWADRWDTVVVARVSASPVTVFVGLGSSAPVLTTSVERVHAAVGDEAEVFQVDTAPRGKTDFSATLGVDDDHYVQLGWSPFMVLLAERLTVEEQSTLTSACASLIHDEGYEEEEFGSVIERMLSVGFVETGLIRSHWLGGKRRYFSRSDHPVELIADLLLTVAYLERMSGLTAKFSRDGVVEFWSEEGVPSSAIVLISGLGHRGLNTVESIVQADRSSWIDHHVAPVTAVATGLSDAPTSPPTAPQNIAFDNPEDSVFDGTFGIRVIRASDVRADAEMARSVVRR